MILDRVLNALHRAACREPDVVVRMEVEHDVVDRIPFGDLLSALNTLGVFEGM